MKKMSIEEIANYIYNEDLGAKAQTKLFREQFELWGYQDYTSVYEFTAACSECLTNLMGIE